MSFDLQIRTLTSLDVSQQYVEWLKDPIVIKYSENQYRTVTLEGQRAYVESSLYDDNVTLLGVFDSDEHIGNVQLVGLTSEHQRVDVSYMIGNRKYWGKGLAKWAVRKAVHKVHKQFKIHKFTAGIASGNIASARVLEHCGFTPESVRKKHLRYGGIWYDQVDYSLFGDALLHREEKDFE